MPVGKGLVATLIVAGVLVFLLLLVGGTLWGTYNSLVNANESVKSAWAQVDNQLQRRGDLIPNLVETVKGYAAHERELFEKIAAARAAMFSATTPTAKMEANAELSGWLGRLLAIAENYPNLKANESFNRLLDELAGTENRIAVERKRYNDIVLGYNQRIKRFPTNFLAGMFGFSEAAYFEAEEDKKELPVVKF
ncbi:MAG: LemA family protein [candidate division Zixibacteria bacterium]|nr:LemA family protein [candidate division Zixibacteria bacterium]MCI0595788.1 LemA family protein [candidate division Zixibacteria bacterium]